MVHCVRKDSISGIPRQVVTSTEALMARPPVLSRVSQELLWAGLCLCLLFMMMINSVSSIPASAVDKGVDLLRPPPHQ
jgi:hypothetical protein